MARDELVTCIQLLCYCRFGQQYMLAVGHVLVIPGSGASLMQTLPQYVLRLAEGSSTLHMAKPTPGVACWIRCDSQQQQPEVAGRLFMTY